MREGVECPLGLISSIMQYSLRNPVLSLCPSVPFLMSIARDLEPKMASGDTRCECNIKHPLSPEHMLLPSLIIIIGLMPKSVHEMLLNPRSIMTAVHNISKDSALRCPKLCACVDAPHILIAHLDPDPILVLT